MLCCFHSSNADGDSYPFEKRMALCRCGHRRKTVLRRTHSKIGFLAAEKEIVTTRDFTASPDLIFDALTKTGTR